MNLDELWSESIHTQQLKNLYRNNSDLVNPIDVRPYLIPFSWEILEKINKYEQFNMSLKNYLREIDNFFCLKFYKILKNINNDKTKLIKTNLGRHFILIKKMYGKFLLTFKQYLNKSIVNIYKNKIELLFEVNNIIDNILEWYVCSHIEIDKNTRSILHTGLVHSEKIIFWLSKHYDYKIIRREGINHLEESDNNVFGCVHIPEEFNILFGGFNKNRN
jgi:hypothetical protein